MATSSLVPYSNPAGKNQTSPGTTSPTPIVSQVPTATPLNPTAAASTNPLVPSATAITSNSVVPAATSTTSAAQLTPGSANAIDPTAYNQINDIYGGTGQLFSSLLGSISGTNSASLQEFIQSLVPQEATAQANLNSALGASGVSANSTVAAIGDANLQSQEFATVSGEAEKLTQSQQDLEAQLIESIMPSAEKQVADSSPLAILGDVLGDVGSAASDVLGLGGITGGLGLGGSSSSSAATVPSTGTSEDSLLESINMLGIS